VQARRSDIRRARHDLTHNRDWKASGEEVLPQAGPNTTPRPFRIDADLFTHEIFCDVFLDFSVKRRIQVVMRVLVKDYESYDLITAPGHIEMLSLAQQSLIVIQAPARQQETLITELF
jgi:hypothetical protein